MTVMCLSDLGQVITGNTPSKSIDDFYDSEDICFVKPSDFYSNSLSKIDKTENYLSEKARCVSRIVPKGSILVTCIGIIGKVAVLNEDAAFNQQINAIIPNKKKVLPMYLAYSLLSKQKELAWQANAAVVPIINKSQFSKLQLDIPDIDSQNKIISVLSKVDTLTTEVKKQLKDLDLLIKSRFIEMFGDTRNNTFNYPICRLEDHIEFLTSGSRGWAKYCTDEGSEWFITIKNVKDCHISVENMQSINAPLNAEAIRTKVQVGDLLVSITADLGRTGVVTKEIAEHGAYINQHLTCIRLNKACLNPLYVAYFMESPAGKEQFDSKNQSAVKAGLNFNSINSLRIVVPPIDKQNSFVSFVAQVDKSKLAVQQSLNELETLKKSLMQQYFG